MAGYTDNPQARLYGGRYTDGDPLGGIPSSRIMAEQTNNIIDEINNVLALRGVVPDFTESNQLATTLLEMIKAAMPQPGQIGYFMRATPPLGWVELNGDTIGNALSGADRANADTQELFYLAWDLALPLQNSSGAPVAVGASAAADWAANRRIVLPDDRGLFDRAWSNGHLTRDEGRVLGSFQEHQFETHTHEMERWRLRTEVQGGSQNRPHTETYLTTTGEPNSGNHGSETRPMNRAWLKCVKL